VQPNHPMALVIALLIEAEQKQHSCFEFAVYEVLNTYMDICGWPDVQRADLYAQLVEKISPQFGLAVKQNIISDCLWATQRRFNG
jgi:hypothetical protein